MGRQLRSLDLTDNRIGEAGARAIATSETLRQLQSLNLRGNKIGDTGARALADSETFLQLQSLDLFLNGVGEAGARAIATSETLRQLQSLMLGGNLIGEAGARAIATSETLRHLQSLDLWGNLIGEAGARAIATSETLRQLQSLVLGDNRIGEAGARAIATSETLRQLQSLHLWGNFIGEVGTRALAASETLRHLQSLVLGGNPIGKAGARAIAASETLRQLQSLMLGDNRIGDAGARALADSETLRQLQSLNLRGNKIGEAGARAIADSKTLRQLQSLNLGNNHIGPTGAQTLAHSETLRQLQSLNLRGNKIGDAGARALAASQTLRQLQSLVLGNNHIGPTGARALAASQTLCQLQSLDLGNNHIGQTGAKALAASQTLRQLQSLNLWGNNIDDSEAQALAASETLRQLQSLDLGNNHIGPTGAQALAHSETFRQLRSLNLTGNNIDETGARAIAASETLRHLQSLHLAGNNLSCPAFACDDLLQLRRYYQISEVEQPVPNPLVRAMLIGAPEVGKTTVRKRLLGERVRLGHEARTHGLERGRRAFPGIAHEQWGALDLTLELWDIGGQRLQHMCHGLFFRTELLYLLVVRQRHGDEKAKAEADHWLELLAHQAPRNADRPFAVIPIVNSPTGVEEWRNYFAGVDRAPIALDIPAKVDLTQEEDTGLTALLARLREQLERYPIRSYWRAIDEIAPGVEAWPEPYFARVEFQRRLQELPAFTEALARIQAALAQNSGTKLDSYQFAQSVQDLLDHNGVVTVLDEPDIVIRQPAWVEKGLYSLVPPEDLPEYQSDECRQFQAKIRWRADTGLEPGWFTLGDAAAYWGELGIPAEEHQDLIKVLCRPELGLVIRLDHPDGATRYCVPAYLDELPDDENLASALCAAYRKATYCEVFSSDVGWPPYFIYRHMVWLASFDNPGKAHLDPRPSSVPRHWDGQEFHASPIRLELNSAFKRHYWLHVGGDPATRIEIFSYRDKLWCFGHCDAEDGASRAWDTLYRDLWESCVDVMRRSMTRLAEPTRWLPCSACMSKALREPTAAAFESLGLISCETIKQSRCDKNLSCPATGTYHQVTPEQLIRQCERIRGETPDKPAIRQAPSRETVILAALDVSLFLHDLGMATLKGKDPRQNPGEPVQALCSDNFYSTGKSIDSNLWAAWLEQRWRNDSGRIPQERTVKRFVDHLVETFPVITKWVKDQLTQSDQERQYLIMKAARNLRNDPSWAEGLWSEYYQGASRRQPKTHYAMKHNHENYQWLRDYLNAGNERSD